jgi:hypothetical protein
MEWEVGSIDINITFALNKKRSFMMKSTMFFGLGLFLVLGACTPREIQDTAKATELQVEELIMEGYKKGTVTQFKELSGNCTYQVDIESLGMAESLEFPRAFQKDGLAVWVNYSMQRRRSSCGTSQPIHIVDMKKREN